MLQDGSFAYPLFPGIEFKIFKLLKALEDAIDGAATALETPKIVLRALSPCRVCCVIDNGFSPISCSCKGPFTIHVVATETEVRRELNELWIDTTLTAITANEALSRVLSGESTAGVFPKPFPPSSFAIPLAGSLLDDWRYDERMAGLKAIAHEYVIFEQNRIKHLHAPPKFYDVCLSFATDARTLAQQVADGLVETGVDVFYDASFQGDIWGENLFEYLEQIYRERSRKCLIFVSKQYAERRWPKFELRCALERETRTQGRYILPVMVDKGVDIAGLHLPSRGWIDGKVGAQGICEAVIEKLKEPR